MKTTMGLNSDERGMTLLAVMAIMAVFAIGLLAVAPSLQMEIQREKELETIRRGEEVAEAIRMYVEFYRGARLPNSMDDLLDGLPQGTKKRAILRASAAVDPLSEDGQWRLVKADVSSLGHFARRVQDYNGGILPSNVSGVFDRYSQRLQGSLATIDDGPSDEPDDSVELATDNTPFIGVVSQSRNKSVLTYYGAENHSKWVFTPLFRGPTRVFRGTAPPRPFVTPPANR
jgi:type II secretory pathway pseudopilin PulG